MTAGKDERCKLAVEGVEMTADPDTFPIACRMDTLTATERGRRAQVLETLRKRLVCADETDDGIAFRLPGGSELRALAQEFVSYESRCCPFLRFGIDGGTDGAPVVLRMGGRPGVKEFLRQTFLEPESGLER